MEPTTAAQTPQPEAPHASLPPKPKSNKLVLLLTAIIILLVGLGAGYMLNLRSSSNQPGAIYPSPSPVSTTNAPTQAMATTPTGSADTAWITYTSTKLKDLSFPAYSIKYPTTWIPEKSNTSVSETYMLTSGEYQIMIYQVPTEGNSCIFSGEMPNHPSQDLRAVKYVDVKTTAGVMLRRYPSATAKPAGTGMDFCGTTNGTDWGSPTQFGVITYKVPVGYTAEKLAEMDTILKTIQEVK